MLLDMNICWICGVVQIQNTGCIWGWNFLVRYGEFWNVITKKESFGPHTAECEYSKYEVEDPELVVYRFAQMGWIDFAEPWNQVPDDYENEHCRIPELKQKQAQEQNRSRSRSKSPHRSRSRSKSPQKSKSMEKEKEKENAPLHAYVRPIRDMRQGHSLKALQHSFPQNCAPRIVTSAPSQAQLAAQHTPNTTTTTATYTTRHYHHDLL